MLDRYDDVLKLDYVLDHLPDPEYAAEQDLQMAQLGGCAELNLSAMEFRSWSPPSARFVCLHVCTQ